MIRLVRESSNIPNVTNKDDSMMARYAYGNMNGYIPGVGSEVSCSVDESNNQVIIGSGRLVLQGWEVVIDLEGAVCPIGGTGVSTIYLEIDLLSETVSIQSLYDPTEGSPTAPEVDPGDDLTENSNGVARLPLYEIHWILDYPAVAKKVVPVLEYSTSLSKRVSDLEESLSSSVKTLYHNSVSLVRHTGEDLFTLHFSTISLSSVSSSIDDFDNMSFTPCSGTLYLGSDSHPVFGFESSSNTSHSVSFKIHYLLQDIQTETFFELLSSKSALSVHTISSPIRIFGGN